MAYGSMAPGLPQMAVPAMQQQNPQDQGMKILMAALDAKKRGGAPGASGGVPALLGPGGGMADIMGGGMGNGLLAKLFPQKPGEVPGAPMSLTPLLDPMSGGMDMGGMGPSPTALTGLW